MATKGDNGRRFVGGDGEEAGSGGRVSDLDGEVLERWHAEWEAREVAARDVLAEQRGPGVTLRKDPDGSVTAFRPGQLIVAQRDVERLRDELERVGARAVDERDGTVLYRLADGIDVLSFVDRVLERCDDDEPAPAIGPNHVFASQQYYQWGPGGPPEPDEGRVEVPEGAGAGKGVCIGVLDTGMWPDARTLHPVLRHRVEWVDSTESSPDDHDPLLDGGPLVRDAGHGTFIAGIIAQRAPGARIDPEATLDEVGFVDEYQLGLDLPDVAEAEILSMSFRGYTHDDRPPVELARLLDALPADVEVVACAGNDGLTRPAWPAAFKRVTGVAAVGRDVEPAPFSNRGHWVDACTYGVLERSTYVTGDYPRADGSVATFHEPVARWSGTSFSAPRFAAAVAAHMSRTGLGARAASADLLANGKPIGGGFGVFVP